MAKKRAYQKKSFESTGVSSDTSANIYMSMLLSDAWLDLTPRQQILYVYAKSRMYGQKTADKKALFQQYDDMKEPAYIDPFFSLSIYEVTKVLKLYSETNLARFYKDMEQLILHGFIKCVACRSSVRSKKRTIFTYSDKWQIWGTDDFVIERKEVTSAMAKKYFSTNISNNEKRKTTNISNNEKE